MTEEGRGKELAFFIGSGGEFPIKPAHVPKNAWTAKRPSHHLSPSRDSAFARLCGPKQFRQKCQEVLRSDLRETISLRSPGCVPCKPFCPEPKTRERLVFSEEPC
jgi:hypothetical protein